MTWAIIMGALSVIALACVVFFSVLTRTYNRLTDALVIGLSGLALAGLVLAAVLR